MACNNEKKQAGRSSEVFLPWELIPVDLEPPSERMARDQRASSSTMLGPNSSMVHQPITDSSPVELSDTLFNELRTALSKICGDENMAFLEDISDQSASPIPTLESTSSMTSSSIVPNTVVDQLGSSSKNVEKEVKHTPLLENKSGRPPPMPEPEPVSLLKPPPPPPLIQNAAEKQSEQSPQITPNASKIKKKDQTTKLINLVRKFPHLYDTEDSADEATKQNEKSWTVISEVLGTTVNDCLTTWRKLRAKNKRKKKELADGRNVSEKTMQFLNSMSFLPSKQKSDIKRKNISEDYTLPDSVPKKRKKAKSSSRSLLERTPSDSLSYSTSETQTSIKKETKTRNQSPNPDRLFTDNIAIELKRVSPHLKNFIKAKMWLVLAEFANPV